MPATDTKAGINNANSINNINGINNVNGIKNVNGINNVNGIKKVNDINSVNGINVNSHNGGQTRKRIVIVGLGMVGIEFMYAFS